MVSKTPRTFSLPSRDTFAASARIAIVTRMRGATATRRRSPPSLFARLGLPLGARLACAPGARAEACQAPPERLPRNAAFGDDGRHELVRRHVEGGVRDLDAARRDLAVEDVRHLARTALLDRDAIAAR